MNEHEKRMQTYIEMIEAALERYLPADDVPQKRLIEAMRYGLQGGGKRIRPVLLLEFCRVSGGEITAALPFACALEMIHAYSLIHDDLPCMDDDDTRRGRPSCHKAFDETTAVLAGDALQSAAFETALNAEHAGKLPPGRALRAAYALARASGAYGMAGGQQMDLDPAGSFSAEAIYALKTGALFTAAAEMGCIAAGADERQIKSARVYAQAVGGAFQWVDDILDAQGGAEQFAIAEKLTRWAVAALDVFEDKSFLTWLAERLLARDR